MAPWWDPTSKSPLKSNSYSVVHLSSLYEFRTPALGEVAPRQKMWRNKQVGCDRSPLGPGKLQFCPSKVSKLLKCPRQIEIFEFLALFSMNLNSTKIFPFITSRNVYYLWDITIMVVDDTVGAILRKLTKIWLYTICVEQGHFGNFATLEGHFGKIPLKQIDTF